MHFMIVRTDPIYDILISDDGSGGEDHAYLNQFVLHSSLDLLKSSMEASNATYLKVVDKFNNSQVSAYITPGGTIFLLLHKGKSEEAIRHFFIEVHDIFARHVLNPLAQLDAPIVSARFDSLVQAAAKRL
jgi:hypothetical protein